MAISGIYRGPSVTDALDLFFRPKGAIDPSQKVQDLTNGYTRTLKRGMFAPVLKQTSDSNLLDSVVIFQFNPDRVDYEKQNNFSNHVRNGHRDAIPAWANGGERIITFKLFLDYTAASQYRLFGSGSSDSTSNSDNGSHINYNDYHTTANNQRGLLPEIEKLEALQYPLNENKPITFINGVPAKQNKMFEEFPRVIFSYGDLHAEGFINSLHRSDILFNTHLNPVRSEFEVSFIVNEARTIDTNMVMKPVQSSLNSRNS